MTKGQKNYPAWMESVRRTTIGNLDSVRITDPATLANIFRDTIDRGLVPSIFPKCSASHHR
jgi:hypothetical protein